MHEYELRILNFDHTLSMSMLTMQLSASMAIRTAQKMAEGKPFEVWRGDDRMYAHEGRKRVSRPAA